MFQEAFQKLDLDETARILDEIQGALGDAFIDPLETTILSYDLDFYPGYRLLEISNTTQMPALQRHVVYSPENTVILDFTNGPIYQLNETVPIHLNKDNVSDYILFYFRYVRGQYVFSHIVESVDDVNWKDDPPPQARKAVGEMIKPLKITPKKNPDGQTEYHCIAHMVVKNALFKADIDINPKAYVKVYNETVLLQDMPVIEDIIS